MSEEKLMVGGVELGKLATAIARAVRSERYGSECLSQKEAAYAHRIGNKSVARETMIDLMHVLKQKELSVQEALDILDYTKAFILNMKFC